MRGMIQCSQEIGGDGVENGRNKKKMKEGRRQAPRARGDQLTRADYFRRRSRPQLAITATHIKVGVYAAIDD